VIGQETGVLYQYETSSGIKWKTFGDGKVQPKYKGEIKNGKMDGLGVLTYPYGEKSVVGEWKNGKEWNTKHTKKDGTLLGKYENGVWIIRWGILFWGKRNGEMNFYKEKWEGVESEENNDSAKYEGELKHKEGVKFGYPEGQGTWTWSDGTRFVGEFVGGFANGQGTITSPSGFYYEGEIRFFQKHGLGTLTSPKGSKSVGQWKDDKPHGKLNLNLYNGDSYEGHWKDGKKHGQGTWISPSQNKKYVGEYKKGKRHGQGTWHMPDGGKISGEWREDDFWTLKEYDKYGNFINAWRNGVSVGNKP